MGSIESGFVSIFDYNSSEANMFGRIQISDVSKMREIAMVTVGAAVMHTCTNTIRRRFSIVSGWLHSPHIAIVTENDLCAGNGTDAVDKCLLIGWRRDQLL